MLSRSTILHLRIPFSVFLMPVFLFAFSQMPQASWVNVALVIVAVHLFLYPASNGFNSYYDKDEDSIGGLEKPPAVTNDLLWASLAFDGAALVLGLFTRVTCFLLFFTMLVATVRHYAAGDGFGGWSHAAEVGIVFFALIFIGPGRFSLDNWWFRKKSNPKNIYIG